MQVFLDSPMAISATDIFKRHPECYDAETLALFHAGRDPFTMAGLHFIRRECAIIFVGFAGRGTLARRIVDGARASRCSAKKSRCARASIVSTVFLRMLIRRFAARLQDTQIEMPAPHQPFTL